MAKWTEDRVLDVVEQVSEYLENGDLDPDSLTPADIQKIGRDPKLLTYYFRQGRTRWAQELFPSTDNDPTGWESFLGLVKDMTGIETSSAKKDFRDRPRLKKDEKEVMLELSGHYRNGLITRDEAHEMLVDGEAYYPIQPPVTTFNSLFPLKISDTGKKVKQENVNTLLGDTYQLLVGAALHLAYIDERVIPEVTLDYEKGFSSKDGKNRLSKSRDIVDYLALTPEGRTVVEVKLGRQRQGLREQVERYRKVKDYKDTFLVLGHAVETPDPAIKNMDAQGLGLVDAETLFEDMDDVKITTLSDLVDKAEKALRAKLKDIKALNWPEKNLLDPHLKSDTGRGYDEYIDMLVDPERMKGALTQIFAMNTAIQLRSMSNDQIKRYREHLYLFNEWLSGPFRRSVKDSRLKRYVGSRHWVDGPFFALTTIMSRIVHEASLDTETRHKIFDENLELQYRIFRYRTGLRRIFGKRRADVSFEDFKKALLGTDTVEFWRQYLPNAEELLEKSTRLDVHYEEDGIFKAGMRAIRRGAPTNKQIRTIEDVLDEKKFSSAKVSNSRMNHYKAALKKYGLGDLLDDFPSLQKRNRNSILRSRFYRLIAPVYKADRIESTLKLTDYTLSIVQGRDNSMVGYYAQMIERKKVNRVHDIYRDFLLSGYGELEDLDNRLVRYLDEMPKTNMDLMHFDTMAGRHPGKGLGYLFDKTHVVEKSMAGKMLNAVRKAKAEPEW